MNGLTVSELAGEVDASPDTLRYYERIGLLPPPPRTAAGYRQYGPDAIERVRFIKQAQRFGLRLADIAGLLAIKERGLCPCGGTRRLLQDRLTQLDEEMTSLSRLRTDIRAMLDQEEPLRDDDGSTCGPGCGTTGLRIGRLQPRSTVVPARRPVLVSRATTEHH
ncbi:MAG TPA: MerR family transcriptional regulator [Acidimicrobiales bacterium]|nr:MerR family transcriptional regulator [Acidimicrobiales bacterium]